ncbi:MAG TPA: hypothetical protein DCS67_01025, partial [Clostridiales bacterium UBA8960]|nr:hypothetical protein [Clostridiales bacterium UBA8960]
MKRVLSLVLALVMVLGMIPTFAADMTGGEHLLEHGFIAGKPGDTDAAKIDAGAALTRQELAALIAELMGEKEIAATFAQPADYADAASIGSWARPFVAYAQYNGWMSGKPGNIFDPTGPVPGQQLAAVLMNALGYTVDTQAKYATVLSDAAALGIPVSSGDLNRGQAFEAMWIAVSEVNVNGEEMTLGVKLGKLDPPVVVPTELAVVSATATNLAEINVKFNMELDVAKVTVANFRVGNADAAAVKLSEDKMTVVVTPNPISAVNPKDYALVVKMAVGLAADYTATVTAFDTTLPVIQSVVLTGPTTFDIIFSEPIVATAPSVLVNNGVYGAAPMAPVGNKVTVMLGAALPDGTYEVKISGYADYAGFPIATTTTSLVYAKDTSALTASITSAKQNEVVVKFSKKIATTLNVNHFYHTFSAWAPNTVTTTDNQTYTLSFTTYTIPEGNFNLVVKATDGTIKTTDVWGIDLAANTTIVGSVTADKTPPTVVVKEVTSESAIKVEFSESVAGATTAANYIVRKADGTALVGVTATHDTGNVYIVNLGGVQPAGVYTIEIKNVTDTALTPNTMLPVVLSFTVTDKTPPTVTAVSWVDTAAATPEYVYVTFSEAVATTGANSALDKNNYRVNGAIIPTEVTAFGVAGTKVRLAVPDGTVVASVTWGQIADLAGNKMVNLTNTTGDVGVPALTLEGAIVAGDIISVTTKSLNTVEVVINKVIPTLTVAAFTVEEGAGGADVAAPAIISYTNDGTKTTVILTLTASTAMINSSDKPANVNFIAGGLVSDTGVTNAAFSIATGDIVDGIAPSYASIAQVDNDTFTITLDEDIKAAQNVSLMATDLVIKKANGTQLVAGVGYTITYATNVITVNLATPLTANETLSVASIAAPQYIV